MQTSHEFPASIGGEKFKLTFLATVAGDVVAYFIIRWLDR